MAYYLREMGLLDFLRNTPGCRSPSHGRNKSNTGGLHQGNKSPENGEKEENRVAEYINQYGASAVASERNLEEKQRLHNKILVRNRERNGSSKRNCHTRRTLSRRYTAIREAPSGVRSTFVYRKSTQAIKFLLFLLAMGSLPGIDPSEFSETVCKYLDYKEQCERELEESKKLLDPNKTYCMGEFDGYMCWSHREAGGVIKARCPDFYRESNDTYGFRYCLDDGTLHQAWDNETQSFKNWSRINDCTPYESGMNETATEEPGGESALLANLRVMYTIGYGVSLFCLVIALLLLGFFKKLHCTRNYIHMNLMLSFIIRYVVILIKDSILTSHYQLNGLVGIAGNPNYEQLKQYCDENNATGWVLTRCRLAITLMHYAITANFFWLLAEGLYLQMLLVFVMSENRYFAGFMVFGWGTPWISVLIWVALRMHYENRGCWDMNDDMHIWWAIRAPIIISIVINFFIFVNIVRLIVSKLQAHNMARTDVKLRLAKSTLALIPLLGIHYIVFFALTEEVTDTGATPMHLKLAFDMFLTSIQGTLVSILYCFLNNEVRTEVRRAWNLWRSRKNLPRGGSNYRKSSATVSGNHSTQVTQLYSRHSTAGGDTIAMENQSPLSVRLDPEDNGNASSSIHSEGDVYKYELSSRNGIVMDPAKKQIYYDRLNGNDDIDGKNHLKTTAIVASVPNGRKTNGSIECQDDEPFLRDGIV